MWPDKNWTSIKHVNGLAWLKLGRIEFLRQTRPGIAVSYQIIPAHIIHLRFENCPGAQCTCSTVSCQMAREQDCSKKEKENQTQETVLGLQCRNLFHFTWIANLVTSQSLCLWLNRSAGGPWLNKLSASNPNGQNNDWSKRLVWTSSEMFSSSYSYTDWTEAPFTRKRHFFGTDNFQKRSGKKNKFTKEPSLKMFPFTQRGWKRLETM